MNGTCRKLLRTVKNRDGFTLIEMLIVIIILGILAMVIIPQITVSTDDAKVSTLKTNLAGMRSAIETYYAQHNMTYPGVKDSGVTGSGAGTSGAFIAQLTQFTDVDGKVSGTKTDTAIYGPYIKGNALPANPFVTDATKANQVSVPEIPVLDITTTRVAIAGGNGWACWPGIGIVFANDGGDSGGIYHITY
ncbi:MAG: type II secretion system protein [Syntrophales bacterium]